MNEEGKIARSLTGEAAVKAIEKTEETVSLLERGALDERRLKNDY
jgi:hypothetical protein